MLAADHIIAISRYVKSQIERQFGEQGKQLTVVQRGVDTEVFDPAAVAQSRIIRFVDSIALPEDEPVIMLPARPTAWKGHETLLGRWRRSPTGRSSAFCLARRTASRLSWTT